MCILACHAYMFTYICGTEKIVGARAYRGGNIAPPLYYVFFFERVLDLLCCSLKIYINRDTLISPMLYIGILICPCICQLKSY